MAKNIIEMRKINHKTVTEQLMNDTYKGIHLECGPMVLQPIRIGKNLQQWLQEINEKEEVRKQA